LSKPQWVVIIGLALAIVIVFTSLLFLPLFMDKINLSTQVAQYSGLKNLNEQLSAENNNLNIRIAQAETDNTSLRSQINTLQQRYTTLSDEYNLLQQRSIIPPYIYIHDRVVEISFVKRDRSIGKWEVPFATLESALQRGNLARAEIARNQFPKVTLSNSATGKKYMVTDYTKFIESSPFTQVIEKLYRDSASDSAFISEVWNIVTQIATYSKEVGDTPRYPLETLLAGGGDCEDSAILFASMIKAAPVKWTIKLVYLDIDNPTRPLTVNHAIVQVNTGKENYLVETTEPDEMEPYTDGVDGWFFDVNSSQVPSGPTQLPAPSAKRISFARGGTTATVQGTMGAYATDHWVLAVLAKQTMTVNLNVPPGAQAALAIYGADGTILLTERGNATKWSGILPKTQDYFIDVKTAAGTVSYTLQVTIPPLK
jgi:cell division protein FtsB